MDGVEEITMCLGKTTRKYGLEVAPFKAGWYNETLVKKAFCLNVPYDTLCFVVISNQSMFQSTFVPYVLKMASEAKDWLDVATDPLDQCMRDTFAKVLSSSFSSNEGIDVYHSFDKDEQGQHTLSCQTAATVSGITKSYGPSDLDEKGMSIYQRLVEKGGLHERTYKETMFPVCIHPRYGGWFSIRGILVFKTVQVGDCLAPSDPQQKLVTQEDIAQLLYLWNNHGMDWRYRDMGLISTEEKYSELQREYFLVDRQNKKQILEKIIAANAKVSQND